MTLNNENLRPEEFTDAGNAALFHEVFRDDFLFTGKSSTRGNWYHWDGQKWTVDNHAATRCAMQLAEAMLIQARERLAEAEEELIMVKSELSAKGIQDLLDGDTQAATRSLRTRKPL